MEDRLRRAAPDAKTYWVGRQSGWRGDNTLVIVVIAVLVVGNWAILGWAFPESTALTRFMLIIGTPPALALTAMLIWSDRRQHRRAVYYVTSAGLFVAEGPHLFRYAIPEGPPVEKHRSLHLGPLYWEALAADGRPWAQGHNSLILSGLRGRTKEVRTALTMARAREASAAERRAVPPAPTGARMAWYDYVLLALVLGFSLLLAIVVWPWFAVLAVFWFAGLLVRSAWCTVMRRPARKAWVASRAPTDARAFGGVNAHLVAEVRGWLARTYGIPAGLIRPNDTLASLEPLRSYRLSTPKVTFEPLLRRAVPESTTVGDLVQRVDAALAAGAIRGVSQSGGKPWDPHTGILPADQVGYMFPIRRRSDAGPGGPCDSLTGSR